MSKKYTEDTFLGRWLQNELTNEELISFKASKEYTDYLKITKAMASFETPEFDKKKVLQAIKTKTAQTANFRKRIPNWMYAAAASIALLFGVVYFISDATTSYATSFGEQLAVVLPDGSEVQLNSKSSLTLKKSDWFDGNRNLTLNGEGYFKVKKGSKFSVQTTKGTVRVLGTQFNVKTTNSYFEVQCFEGKVKVVHKEDSAILTKGVLFKHIEGAVSEKRTFDNTSPSWLHGESSFTNTPLHVVLVELEKQYHITMLSTTLDTNQLFTGTFSNTNLELALQTVCIPLSIKYAVNGSIVSLTKD
jgi:ferric-dicitrate binding protein FerR (iron transport regulator)